MHKKWVYEKLGWQINVKVRDACAGMNYNNTLWDNYLCLLPILSGTNSHYWREWLAAYLDNLCYQASPSLLCELWYNGTNKRQVAEATLPGVSHYQTLFWFSFTVCQTSHCVFFISQVTFGSKQQHHNTMTTFPPVVKPWPSIHSQG